MHREPMVNTASSQAEVRSSSAAQGDRGWRGEARAKNTIHVRNSDADSFFSSSVRTLNHGLTVRTFPPEHFFLKALQTEAESA